MERLGSIVQVRRGTTLAEARRPRDVLTRASGLFDRIDGATYLAFDDRLDGIGASVADLCLVDEESSFVPVVRSDPSECAALVRDWHSFVGGWPDVTPTVTDYNNRWVPGADRFVSRLKSMMMKAKAEKDLATLPSDYGAPLPPVEPGSGPAIDAPPKSRFGASLGGASTTTVIVLVVAAVAALGGFLLLRKGT